MLSLLQNMMLSLRYAMSEIRKHANRVGFNVPEAEVHGGADHTKSLGMLGHAGMSGKVCAAAFAAPQWPFVGLARCFVTRPCAGAHDSSKRQGKSQHWDAEASRSHGQQLWWKRCNKWSQFNRCHQRAHGHGF